MEQEYILSVQARNHAGVLLRISGLFSRRGYNIKSLIAAQTEDPEYSEIIIVVQGNETVVRLVQHQLLKLIDIERVTLLPKDNIVTREHLLIKVGMEKTSGQHLIAISNIFHANILSVSESSMILELTGDAGTLNRFVEECRPFGIKKVLRTGSMAMEAD